MRIHRLSLAAVVMAFAVAGVAAAGDKKIQAKDLPPAVQKAVQEQTKGATIKGYSTETEDGKTMYEVETLVNGHTRDLLFDATGALVSAEEATAVDAVPAPVKAALEARGKVLSIETITKGKTILYEGVVQKNGKKTEVVVDADGKPAKP
jgi:uncharacterized membrane protein YkoI